MDSDLWAFLGQVKVHNQPATRGGNSSLIIVSLRASKSRVSICSVRRLSGGTPCAVYSILAKTLRLHSLLKLPSALNVLQGSLADGLASTWVAFYTRQLAYGLTRATSTGLDPS